MISLPVIRNKQIQISYCSEYILMMFDMDNDLVDRLKEYGIQPDRYVKGSYFNKAIVL